MVRSGRLDWRGVADRMSVAPARIGRASAHGQGIAVGSRAHVVLVDSEATWVVDPQALASKSHNSPYAGMTLPGRVEHVLKDGRFTVRNAMVAT
jgi:dihydroorotase